MDYQTLRKQYPECIYEAFHADWDKAGLSLRFDFHIPGLCSFAPTWLFPLSRVLSAGEKARAEEMAFALGLAELISYWKPVCSPTVRLRAGFLHEAQIKWWQELFYHGLGEFYYCNGIPRRREDMPVFINEAPSRPLPPEEPGVYGGALIPVGGGKDSLVTLSHCPEKDSACFFVNPKPSAPAGAQAAGYGEDRLFIARRTLDARLLDLNRQGFLNGHTPFSALLAFSSVLCAYLNGQGRVVLSNEQSANEPTDRSGANHQYSKSFAFERDFSEYLKTYLTGRVSYFSFLRPISELQIAALFAAKPEYHGLFRSCNKGSREDKWCAVCAKCLFVYIILSPFLPPEKLRGIFGTDLWENEALLEDFNGLTGIIETKPFECVGSRDEVCAALNLCLRRYYPDGTWPFLLRQFIEQGLYDPEADSMTRYRSFYCAEHQLPDEYDAALRKALAECPNL